jgi:hypothetical protein
MFEKPQFPLYNGRNDKQEFWDTPHTPSIMLLRLLREDDWSVYQKTEGGNFRFMFTVDSAEEGARRAGVKLDTTKIWKRNVLGQQYLIDVKVKHEN